MKTFFILGRNPELSRAEILEFLKARVRTHKEILFEENILIIETNENEKFDIQEFGGVMYLGEILFNEETKNLPKHLEKNELIPSDKFSYAIFGNQETQILKEKFKKERKKAIIKYGRKKIKFQDGTKSEIPNVDFYILFHKHKKMVYLGIVTQKYSNTEVRKRDMQKPIRREYLAISPRLAKILINLSGAKPHDLLLDPFCGVGGILQEALLKKINVYGIDKDKQATINAEKNLKWLKNQYNFKSKYKIENTDSRKTPDFQFTAIATEAPLGKTLRKKPNDEEAKQIITDFEAYIIPILIRLKKIKKPSAKIAITFPVVKTYHVDVKKIATKTELKIYMEPILESRDDQYISRDIVMLQ